MCKSDPHNPAISTLTTTSVGSLHFGSGRSSTTTLCGSLITTARMLGKLLRKGLMVGKGQGEEDTWTWRRLETHPSINCRLTDDSLQSWCGVPGTPGSRLMMLPIRHFESLQDVRCRVQCDASRRMTFTNPEVVPRGAGATEESQRRKYAHTQGIH